MDTPKTIAEFAAALRAARAGDAREPALLAHVHALASAWVAREGAQLASLACEPDAEQGFGVRLLHEEPDHTLATFVVSWHPGRGTPPHDHGTWAVVVGLAGRERNERWRSVGGRVEPGGALTIGPGDSVALGSGDIHSVHNDSDAVSVSLHVYGRHVNHTARSQYDPVTRTRSDYKVKVAPSPDAR